MSTEGDMAVDEPRLAGPSLNTDPRLMIQFAKRFRLRCAALLVGCAAGVIGCGASSSGAEDSGANAPDGGTAGDLAVPRADLGGDPVGDVIGDPDAPIGGARPVMVHVPPGYDAGVPAPLVIMLHGYSSSGAVEELYLRLTVQSDARGFLYAYPDGTPDQNGLRFWNATDACCNFSPPMIDDSGYLSGVIQQIEARYSVDPKRVFFFGHSNGGFMAYRMACDHSEQIAAIASLAGAMPLDLTACPSPSPISILEIHGTADQTILFGGGENEGHTYPGATTTVADWVGIDGCTNTADTSAPPLDLDVLLAGNETTVSTYAAGCKPGGHAELWTIQGGSHIPALSSTFASDVVDFLYAHPKP